MNDKYHEYLMGKYKKEHEECNTRLEQIKLQIAEDDRKFIESRKKSSKRFLPAGVILIIISAFSPV